MVDYEEKFIVINFKRFEELNKVLPWGTFGFAPNQSVLDLQMAFDDFKETYEANIGPLDQKYYVCNQDEPYADKILEIILKGEAQKKADKESKSTGLGPLSERNHPMI